jgi:hypothetical protein
VLSLTFAFVVHAQDALTVCAFKFKLFHLFALLLIQGPEFVCGHLSAVGANKVFWFYEPGLLITQAKYFIASIAHDGVWSENEAETANVVLNQNLVNGVSVIQSWLQLSFGSQTSRAVLRSHG